jgi:thiamine transport system substrate-binding protein
MQSDLPGIRKALWGLRPTWVFARLWRRLGSSKLATLSAAFGLVWGVCASGSETSLPVLSVYVYDSLVGEGSFGEWVKTEFEKRCRCTLKFVPVGSGTQLVSRIELDAVRAQGRSSAPLETAPPSLVWGVDTLTARELEGRALPWLPSKSQTARKLKALRQQWKLDRLPGFVPIDFGELAWIVDRRKFAASTLSRVSTWTDFFGLLGPEEARPLLIQDPRTSVLGLQLVLWVREQFPQVEQRRRFWLALRARTRTLAPSWSSAYSLFLRGEAAAVWSYSTSEAYHREEDRKKNGPAGDPRYFAWLPPEGAPIQLEGALLLRPFDGKKGMTASSQGRSGLGAGGLEEAFLEFLLSREAQSALPTRHWMQPVDSEAERPASFRALPRSTRGRVLLPTSGAQVQEAIREWEGFLRGSDS